MKTLSDANVSGKKVIVRVDFNVPLNEDGSIRDDARIQISIPTLKKLLDDGASQVIVMTHVGRPKGNEEKLKTGKIAERLSSLLDKEVAKVDDWGESGLSDAPIIMLENLRFHAGEKSKDASERDAFGKQLASLADVYVNDAFSNCHRDHASMTSVPKFIPGYAGLGLQKEVETLQAAITSPEHPVVAIVGGVKEEKVKAIERLLTIADKILIGGTMIFWIMKANGEHVGDSKIGEEYDECEDRIKAFASNPKIVMPTDYIIADAFSADAQFQPSSHVDPGWLGVDIGPETIDRYKNELRDAKTVLWFGPVGAFEFEGAAQGTKELAHYIGGMDAVKISGGGESGEALKEYGLADKMTLISTGGGSSLRIVCGEDLVALKSL